MSILQAIVLGIVQGLTEFIPVSSTAHLIFAARLMSLFSNLDQAARSEQTTASIAVIQLGTLVAVLLYFSRDILSITISFIRDHMAYLSERGPDKKRFWDGLSDDTRLGWLVIIGSIPIGVIGLKLKKVIEGPNTKNLWLIATMMILVAVLLAIAESVSTRRRNMRDLGIRDALAVGFAQVLALMPGSSRSGSTIMAGLFVGETRETAARFSFLLSMPAVFASGVLELKSAVHDLPSNSYVSLALATVVAGIIGYGSIWFLLRFLRTHSTWIFIGYRWILGGIIIAALALGYISPLDNRPAEPNQSLNVTSSRIFSST